MAKINTKGVPKYTPDVPKTMLLPWLLELSKLLWYLGLAVKICRQDLQLAPNVGDAICDPANIPLSRAAMKRKNKWKTTTSSLLLVVTKGVHPSQLLYLIRAASARNVGTDLPCSLCDCTFCPSHHFSFFSLADSFQRQRAPEKKMLPLHSTWQRPLV